MSIIIRTWLGFAAIGAGMIHLALVISSPPAIAGGLLVIGLGELGWGVLALAREGVSAPRVILAGAMLPMLLWALLVVVGAIFELKELTASLGFIPLGLATVLELFIAVCIAVLLRRGTDLSRPARAPSAGRYLLGLTAGGLIVAGLTTPALAATEAGAYAQPHGEHSDNFQPREGYPFDLGHEGH